MLTLKDIKLAINNLIIARFPDIEIQQTDTREGFQRPSFFVLLDNVSRNAGKYTAERGMTVRIHYFPSDRYNYSLENLDVQEALEGVFDLDFAVKDRVITINESYSQTVDGVLEFEFIFEYTEGRKSSGEERPKMEELIIDV